VYLVRIGDRRAVLEIKRTGNNTLRWVDADAPTMVVFPQSRENVLRITYCCQPSTNLWDSIRTERTVKMFYRNPRDIKIGIFI